MDKLKELSDTFIDGLNNLYFDYITGCKENNINVRSAIVLALANIFSFLNGVAFYAIENSELVYQEIVKEIVSKSLIECTAHMLKEIKNYQPKAKIDERSN